MKLSFLGPQKSHENSKASSIIASISSSQGHGMRGSCNAAAPVATEAGRIPSGVFLLAAAVPDSAEAGRFSPEKLEEQSWRHSHPLKT